MDNPNPDRFIEVTRKNSRSSGDGSPKDYADLSVVNGGKYINFYPSPKALDILKEWKRGVRMTWQLRRVRAGLRSFT